MTQAECLFCRIINHSIPADIVAEREGFIAINDIHPQAPKHCLVVPKIHITSINDLTVENAHVVSEMALMAQSIAKHQGIDSSGYRLVMNTGSHAGQSVHHLHMHILGGRSLSWPPG